MNEKDDWRLRGQEKYLQGITLFHRRYRQSPRGPHWDHDHCEFCWAKFMLGTDPDILHQGYASEDDDQWICEGCFADFTARFGWRVVEALA